jgi:cell division septation protein DedD
MTEARNEKELILGNKQLISLFFVVVALCGVCFAMGYIIGRSSSKPAVAADASQPQAATPAHSQDPEPPRETSQASSNSAADASSASPAAQDSAAADNPVATSSAPASDPVMTRPGRDVPEPERVSEREIATTTPVSAPQPGGGAYLQVGAVSKVDADNLVRTLKEEKLPALMVESPKKGLYRVLVGPYRQTADLAEAKSRLKTLGFDNAFVQR